MNSQLEPDVSLSAEVVAAALRDGVVTLDALHARCSDDPVFGCWLWLDTVGKNGRPLSHVRGKPISTYTLSYTLVNGPVPPGMVADHRCRITTCIRPLHLEAVTRTHNEQLKLLHFRLKRKQCPRGHKCTESTRLLSPRGGLLCRACIADDRSAFKP
jgi:hypothetical protein